MIVNIYHTNDIHSNYNFLKNVNCYLQAHRTENDFYFDSGDFCDLKSILVQSDKGISAMELLMECGLDAMALGNNEIDLEYTAIAKMVEKEFPILCCNITDTENRPIPGLRSSVVLEKMGKRFLVLGVAPYYGANMRPNAYNLFFEMGNLRTQDTMECIQLELEKQQGKYDFCILLTHSGIKVDGEIRRRFPGINLFLGGHSHTILSECGYSQSGRGERLGKVSLEIEGNNIKEVENIQIEPVDEENPCFGELLRRKEEEADRILSKELKVVDELSFDPLAECDLINFICDCLRKRFGGDIALMHHGIAEKSLLRPVSVKSLLETFPSKLNPAMYSISGEKIAEAIWMSFDEAHITGSGAGAGFRGQILGTLGFSSNVRIKPETMEILIDGQRLDKTKEYMVVTDDYLQRGTGYPSLKVENEKADFDKWFIRDLVQHFLEDEEVFAQAKIRRRKIRDSRFGD